MKIAIDTSPLNSGHYLQHRVRGTGFYLTNLRDSLLKYFPKNTYQFFSRGEKLDSDVNLVHYPYFEPFFLTLPLFSNQKYVATVHDLTPLVFPQSFPAGLKGNMKWNLQKASLKRAKSIITDSESSKRDLIKIAGVDASRVKVVYLAAGEQFKPVAKEKVDIVRQKYNLPGKFALYVGDATWNKNLPRLVEAIKKINIPIVMVGKALTNKEYDKSNPWNADLAKVQKETENDSNFIFPGFVEDADLVSIYNGATLFVAPSLYEGFGLPILEAMACGCPVITSQEGSLGEVAGAAAYFVDAYKSDSIAEGIKKVYEDSGLQKELKQKGLKRAAEFSWKNTALNTVKVYESVT